MDLQDHAKKSPNLVIDFSLICLSVRENEIVTKAEKVDFRGTIKI